MIRPIDVTGVLGFTDEFLTFGAIMLHVLDSAMIIYNILGYKKRIMLQNYPSITTTSVWSHSFLPLNSS